MIATRNIVDAVEVAQLYSESVPGAPLEDVLYVGELERRACRAPNDDLLGKAMAELLQGFSIKPGSVLQSLTETIQQVLHCDSAGVSLINEDDTRFFWPAISGVLTPHVGEGTPRNFGPCGDVLTFNRTLHMHHMHRRYTYLATVPVIKEALLAPFHFHGKAVGTVWAIIHEPPNNAFSSVRQPLEFDREDMRVLDILARLATAAYEIWLRQSSDQRLITS